MGDRDGQYNDFAYYYDELTGDIDYDSWCGFIIKALKDNNIKYNDVLEMACGTGNMSFRMAERGYNVTAFDLSSDMLSIASGKALDRGVNINFLCQDMRDIKIKDKYGIILCMCDSINYLDGSDDLMRLFKWVNCHLKDGGIFIFDINSSYKLRQIIGNNIFTYDNDNIVYIWDNSLYTDKVEFSLTFFIKQGRLYKRFDESHVERIYETDHVIECLEGSGLNDIQCYDGYTFCAVHDRSERISFIALKK